MSAKNKRVIVEELSKIGLNAQAIAGIMANLEYENGFRTTVGNGDGGQASGIAQWHPDRFARVIRIAKKMGVKPTNIRAQARALALSIKDENQSGPTGTTTVKSLNRIGDPAGVAKFFDENYERSDGTTRQARMRAAKQYVGVAKSVGKKTSTSGKTYTWVPAETGHNYNTFGAPNSRYKAGKHTGNDIGAPDGSPIQWAPPVDGKVIKVSQDGAYGPNWMIVRDELGREWLFAHMAATKMKVGTRVTQGMQIGQVGKGHLHLEQTRKGPGGWDYNDPSLKAPRLVFKSKRDYNPSGDPNDLSPGDYGMASWVDPEVQDLIKKAARMDWSQDRFQWKLRETEWYQTRSESQRQFDMKTEVDKQADLKKASSQVKQLAGQFGVPLTKQQIEREALRIARDGATDAEQRAWFARKYVYDPEKGQSGIAATFQESLMDMAAEYGLKLTDKELQRWTRKSIRDGADEGEFEDDMRKRAQVLYPHLDLSTRNLRQALSPFLQQASNELDIDPNTVDLTDPKWSEVFDPATNDLLGPEQWRAKIVSDRRYGWDKSRNGQSAAANLAASLGRIFGGLN